MKKANKLGILVCLILLSTSAFDPFVFANTVDEETSASVEETIASDAVPSPALSVEEPTDESIEQGQEDAAFIDTSESNVSEGTSSSEKRLTAGKSLITGSWGTVPFSFDKDSGQLNIEGGTIQDNIIKPWDTEQGQVEREDIKTIVVSSRLVLPKNSSLMFYRLRNLTEIIGIENFDTSKVTDMSGMFSGASNLQTLDVSKFDTSNVTDMSHMFYYAERLPSLDLSKFDTSNVTDMSYMFYYAERLPSLDLSNFDTSNVTTMRDMFARTNLQTLDLSSFDTSKVTDMSFMFASTRGLQTLDLSNFDTSNVTDMSYMFYQTQGAQTLDLSNFDTSNVTTMKFMISYTKNLQTVDLSSFDTSKVTDMSYMFYYAERLQSLDLSNFDTSSVIDISGMFLNTNLPTLDLSNFDTSNVTKMNYMFSGTKRLQTLDLSSFDTSSVTDMSDMFNSSAIQTLDLSSFDTSNVTNMSNMFSSANLLNKITLSHNFRFKPNSGLPAPQNIKGDDKNTGKWIKQDGSTASYTPIDFMNNYGSGELTGGTYVPEVLNRIHTESTFDQKEGTIGKSLSSEFVIKNESEYETGVITLTINNFLDSTVKDNQNFQFDPKLKVERYLNNDRKISEDLIAISEKPITLVQLYSGQYYKVLLSGTVWNTSTETPEGNYEIHLDYTEPSNGMKMSSFIKGYHPVKSGTFGFSSVPENLTFENTALTLPVKETIINRELSSWSVT
ncbi:fibronectin type iii domain protein, partial [Enterococcus sp. C1]|uniref:BspA family leucine-rich repeat surface protein n=1 Tax=Enterococcus sp. C1 TaxID=1182762 RepID=UPI0002721E57